MNKKNKILILFLYLGLILIFLIYTNNHIPCLLKKTFNIPCPACGLTRAFNALLNLKIIESFSYNILTLAIIIILGVILICTIIDIMYNKHHLDNIIKKITQNYPIILFLLILSWIINIYRNI